MGNSGRVESFWESGVSSWAPGCKRDRRDTARDQPGQTGLRDAGVALEVPICVFLTQTATDAARAFEIRAAG